MNPAKCEVFYTARTPAGPFEVHPGAADTWQCWNIFIEPDRVFVMDRLSIMGVASNLTAGTFRVEDASIGKFIFELPLLWWAVRPRRALIVPWVFKPASCLRLTIGFKGIIPPAFDLLGRPKLLQRLIVVAEGKDVFQY